MPRFKEQNPREAEVDADWLLKMTLFSVFCLFTFVTLQQ